MEDSGIDSDPKPSIEGEKLFQASDSSTNSSTGNAIISTPPRSNVKQLHRKLEMRIEQAKKIQRLQEYKANNTSLIPIQRLPIPSKTVVNNSNREQQPLVDWDTDESDEDINFFPLSRLKEGKQELTDTFSIEDFEVSPDEDDLNLLTPKPSYNRCMCCTVPLDVASCAMM